MNSFDEARSVLRQPAEGLAVFTPSYSPDFLRFVDLHRSVLRYFPSDVIHYVVVPNRDVALFSELAGARCRVVSESSLLPKGMLRVPGFNLRLSVRTIQPPMRGWIAQQMLKLSSADVIDADVIVMVDSDCLFVRPVAIEDFTRGGQVTLFRLPMAVTQSLPRHMRWTLTAAKMLDVPIGQPPHTDYVSSLNTWDRRLVLALRRRIEEVSERRWTTELGRHLLLSEWVLYGMFVETAAQGTHQAETSDMRCRTYWSETPMDHEEVVAFFRGARETEIAVMLSAKAGVTDSVRRAAFRELGYLPN